MGFGYLLLGYFFEISLEINGGIDIFPNLWGDLVMLAGLISLHGYEPQFDYAKRPLYLHLGASAGLLALQVAASYLGGILTVLCTALASLCVLLNAWFHCHLLLGMRDICLRADVPSVVRAVKRNLYFGTVYYPLLLLYTAGLPLFGRYTAIFSMLMPLFSLVWIVCNFLPLFSCYRFLCPGTPEDQKKASTPKPKKQPSQSSHKKG